MITIISLFDDEVEARKVIQMLMETGVDRNDITLMTNTAESGAVISEEPEWISGAANRVDIDAGTGDYIGHLKDLSVPDQDAKYFDEEVRRGQTLVALSIDESVEESAMNIINSTGTKNSTRSYGVKSRRAAS